MDLSIKPGVYVVAVSGGVDSTVLLHLLKEKPGLKLVVAHFDHGIRDDSTDDRRFVAELAESYGLPFVYHEGNLGPEASEDEARRARYEFLHAVRQSSGAQAILTAHHHDDALETAVHNLLRGTGRKGLSSLKNTEHVKRPLLRMPKQSLKAYAEDQGLRWREDSTNVDVRYIRNHIRHNILPLLTLEQKAELLRHIQKARSLNSEIDHLIADFLDAYGADTKLDRQKFIELPHIVAREVMAAWLRQNGVRSFDRKLLEKLVIAAKTYAIGKAAHVSRDRYLLVEKKHIVLRNF